MFYIRSLCFFFFFFKQKTAYEMRISDWSSDVCSSDLDALRFIEFATDFAKSQGMDTEKLEVLYRDARQFIAGKKPNQMDTAELLTVKGLIRKGEAITGARFAGLPDENIHFQNLPFYDRGKYSKELDFEDDIVATMELLQAIKPQQIFAAGDFADPHGTHKVCFDIIYQAMTRLRKTEAWTKDCWLWLYRGAWHEFEIHEIEMAVPLSPKEVLRKRHAIFKRSEEHTSELQS